MTTEKKLTKKEISLICFEILGRHFPGASGKDSPELREILNVLQDISGTPDLNERTNDAAEWKKAACVWLSENIPFKK